MTIRYDGWLDISANVPTNALPLTPKALWLSNDLHVEKSGVEFIRMRYGFLFSPLLLFLFFSFFFFAKFFKKIFLWKV